MHNDHACDEPCALDCAEACVLQASSVGPPIDVTAAQKRFEKEAVRGVCSTGRYRMSYFVWGDGPPLVLIHGLGDRGLSFVPVVSRLSPHFRCVAYDLPAGGRDGARVRRYVHGDFVHDLWALLDHLRLDRAYLLGSSYGSTIALAALREQPERLPRGVLQGGMAYRPLMGSERWIARVAQFLPGTMGALRGREKVLRKVHGEEFAGRPPEAWRYFIDVTATAPIAAFGRLALLLDRLDLRQLLPEVRQPVLLVCGDRDAIVPKRHGEMLLAGLPIAGRVTIEGCGHLPSHTHPEALAEVVRQFLTPPARPNGA